MEEDRTEEPFAVQEIWLDGFSGVHVVEENLRCTAFSMQGSHPVAVVRLVMSARTARFFIGQVADELNMKVAAVRLVRDRRRPG